MDWAYLRYSGMAPCIHHWLPEAYCPLGRVPPGGL
jgi:hypothetical protein